MLKACDSGASFSRELFTGEFFTEVGRLEEVDCRSSWDAERVVFSSFGCAPDV